MGMFVLNNTPSLQNQKENNKVYLKFFLASVHGSLHVLLSKP